MELAGLNKIVEEQAARNSDLARTINEQVTKISVLSREIAECKKENKRIKEAGDLSEVVKMLGGKFDLGVNRKKADFECELDGAGAFLELNGRRYSRYFFAGNLAWCVEFGTKVEGEDRFLSIFLHAKSYAGGKWSINAVQELSVLSQSGGQDSSLKCTNDFSTDNQGWGFPKFISASKLRTGGYIKDNKINVRAHLELGELVRTE